MQRSSVSPLSTSKGWVYKDGYQVEILVLFSFTYSGIFNTGIQIMTKSIQIAWLIIKIDPELMQILH